MESGFQALDSGFLVSGTWIPDPHRGIPDSLSPGFQIPLATIFLIPDSTSKNFADSPVQIILHGASHRFYDCQSNFTNSILRTSLTSLTLPLLLETF